MEMPQKQTNSELAAVAERFALYLSVERAGKVLEETRALLFDGQFTASPLSGLPVSIERMTPDEWANGGASLTVNYSFADTPFGRVIIGSTEKGVCHMTFADEGEPEAVERMKSALPNAVYRQFFDRNQQNALTGFTRDRSDTDEIKLHLKGTDFQLKIWKTLLQVPAAGLITYSDLAAKAGCERAQRAVGTALGNNPVVFLIPCHRVIQSSGIIGNYRYGEVRKKAIIGWEALMCARV